MSRPSVFLFLALSCCFALLGQNAPPSPDALDLNTYESFFQAVSQLTPGKAMGRTVKVSPGSTLNGEPANLMQPELEDALGITGEEAPVLRGIAADCEAKSAAIHQALKPLVLELRFAALAEEIPPQTLSRRYDQLNRERTQTVLDHIRELKSALGEARFLQIEAFVGARKNSPSFFPAVPRGAGR